MKNPLVSIIIPIYNSEAFLDKCIQSAINQSYKNIEIILVNDGSIDSSGEICNNYSSIDDRIKTIHKNNGGLVSAHDISGNGSNFKLLNKKQRSVILQKIISLKKLKDKKR